MFFIGRQAQVNHQSVATKKLAVIELQMVYTCKHKAILLVL